MMPKRDSTAVNAVCNHKPPMANSTIPRTGASAIGRRTSDGPTDASLTKPTTATPRLTAFRGTVTSGLKVEMYNVGKSQFSD